MNRSHHRSRRGVLLFCVLVCLLVTSAIATATMQSALRARREVRWSHQMQQTQWLLEAGVHRAAKQLRQSDQYQGETWRPADAIAHFDNAAVVIRVTPADDGSNEVNVTARLGVGLEDTRSTTVSRTTRSHQFLFRSPENSSDSEPSTTE